MKKREPDVSDIRRKALEGMRRLAPKVKTPKRPKPIEVPGELYPGADPENANYRLAGAKRRKPPKRPGLA